MDIINHLLVKRIYSEFSHTDGYRILVDRLWPRGITKERAHIDYWAKEITPSTELRKTFNHDENTIDEFKIRYYLELDNNEHRGVFIDLIRNKLNERNVTLLYAAKNETYNHAHVLKEWIKEIIS